MISVKKISKVKGYLMIVISYEMYKNYNMQYPSYKYVYIYIYIYARFFRHF